MGIDTPKKIAEKPVEDTRKALGNLRGSVSHTADDMRADLLGNAEKAGKAAENVGTAIENLASKFDPLQQSYTQFKDKISALFGGSKQNLDAKMEQAEYGLQKTERLSPEQLTDTMKAGFKALTENPEWLDFVENSAAKHGFPPALILGIIGRESTFKTAAKNGPFQGLAQAGPRALEEYGAKGYSAFRKETSEKYHRSLPATPNAFDPATAIDFVGFHLNQKIAEANEFLEKHKNDPAFPVKEEYRLSKTSRAEYLYLAYNSGGKGYVLGRIKRDNPNFQGLEKFQEKPVKNGKGEVIKKADGTPLLEWEARFGVADDVTKLTQEAGAIPGGVRQHCVDHKQEVGYRKFAAMPLPAGSFSLTSLFGTRVHPTKHELRHHNGLDLAAAHGTPVKSIENGTVTKAVPNGNGEEGNFVEVRHADGTTSSYLHLAEVNVSVGTQVEAGKTIIGKVGSTGESTGPHLHLLVKDAAGKAINVAYALQKTLENQTA